jgi:hypothetical protein
LSDCLERNPWRLRLSIIGATIRGSDDTAGVNVIDFLHEDTVSAPHAFKGKIPPGRKFVLYLAFSLIVLLIGLR